MKSSVGFFRSTKSKPALLERQAPINLRASRITRRHFIALGATTLGGAMWGWYVARHKDDPSTVTVAPGFTHKPVKKGVISLKGYGPIPLPIGNRLVVGANNELAVGATISFYRPDGTCMETRPLNDRKILGMGAIPSLPNSWFWIGQNNPRDGMTMGCYRDNKIFRAAGVIDPESGKKWQIKELLPVPTPDGGFNVLITEGPWKWSLGKLNTDLNLQWRVPLPLNYNWDDYKNSSINVDPSGNSYVTANNYQTHNKPAGLIMKIDGQGRSQWPFEARLAMITLPPLVTSDGGVIYWERLNDDPAKSTLVKLSSQGKELWRQPDLGPIDDLQLHEVPGDLVVVSSRQRGLQAFDVTSGKARWQNPEGSRLLISPENQLYSYSYSSLHRLDPENGRIIWTTPATQILEPPVFGPNKELYLLDAMEGVYRLDPQSGNIHWHMNPAPKSDLATLPKKKETLGSVSQDLTQTNLAGTVKRAMSLVGLGERKSTKLFDSLTIDDNGRLYIYSEKFNKIYIVEEEP